MGIGSTDNGSLIPKSEAAIVTADGGTRLELLLPEYGHDEEVPALVLYLTACLLRSEDEEFKSEMVAWFQSQATN